MIREITITNATPEYRQYLNGVSMLFSKLTSLSQLNWNGSLNVPDILLETLSGQFPKAALTIRVRQPDIHGAAGLEQPLRFIGNFLAGSQLTVLHLCQATGNRLYSDFKTDLMAMLTRNRVLRKLYIHSELDRIQEFPEMLDCFRGKELPKLQGLWIYLKNRQLFTKHELFLWGAQGGWEDLTYLYLFHSHHMLAFLGQAPRLTNLSLSPRQQANIAQLETFLDDNDYNPLFDCLKSLTFRGSTFSNNLARRHLVPWCMLERLPKLMKLEIHRMSFVSGSPGPLLQTPDVQDVIEIRRLCPELTSLSMDLTLQNRSADWPYDILLEVTRFEKLTHVVFYLHILDSKIARASVNEFTCFSALTQMIDEMKLMDSPSPLALTVGFKVVRPWNIMESNWNIPDYRFTIRRRGDWRSILVHNQAGQKKNPDCLDKITTDELVARRKIQFSRWFGVDSKGYQKEIQRRYRDDRPET
ncbi:hypothetical protein P153DRAFT_362262 [Dothidotthia symphoricarpi CBS 119687]|uniref:F-box domain-containing protein n=1 Tax=Dothidotthia symphoricarpi CBS 119687 TaxID=1392245 RepID=A0A6A6AU61_9PLEO|nr:uncharacterized protein P153DRAFT_362262 [Dothidotthia symphoricarpi CBS 119687]KAF2134495.1 hypothetical protein P153DRAFT_362262 [Dothidotthia symphoricarpi CBS 119687]